MRRVVLATSIAGGFVAAACSSSVDGVSPGNGGTSGGAARDGAGSPERSTPAFAAGASVPKVHSCNGAGESIPPVRPPPRAHEYELSVHAFPTATLPSASGPTRPFRVDVVMQGAPLQPRSTTAGSIAGYTRE